MKSPSWLLVALWLKAQREHEDGAARLNNSVAALRCDTLEIFRNRKLNLNRSIALDLLACERRRVACPGEARPKQNEGRSKTRASCHIKAAGKLRLPARDLRRARARCWTGRIACSHAWRETRSSPRRARRRRRVVRRKLRCRSPALDRGQLLRP